MAVVVVVVGVVCDIREVILNYLILVDAGIPRVRSD